METTWVFTMDDVGSGPEPSLEAFRRTFGWLGERGLHGTFFVVPRPGGKELRAEWLEALRQAADEGHDLQLHGLTHADCFEFGPPVAPATYIRPAYAEEYEQRRAELLPRYTADNIRLRLEMGLEVFEGDLGLRPTVFRAPCGSISRALFAALRHVGIRYDSSQYINLGCYNHLPHRAGNPSADWTDRWPHRPFRWYSDIIELPLLGEYTWRDAWRCEDDFLRLLRADADRIGRESALAILLCHTHGVADNVEYALRLFAALLKHLEERGGCRIATLGELAASAALESMAQEAGPDILTV